MCMLARHEQIVTVELQVLITLVGDPAYKFIHVEDFGYVTSYAPRTSFGDFQTMLSVSTSCIHASLLVNDSNFVVIIKNRRKNKSVHTVSFCC